MEAIDFPSNVLVTVSRVESSQDVTHCKVFISVFPESEIKNTLAVLDKVIYFIQQSLNKSLKMRPVPQIRFVEEERVGDVQRVENILDKVKTEGGE